mgnify:CR=1 FL=1
MNAKADLVIQDLLNQIANISREKAIFYALATEKQKEIEKLKKEIEGLKKAE